VVKLDTCEKCKNQLGFDDLFCPKCGVRTPKGRREQAEIPWEEHMAEVREKIDKAVAVAFEEVQKGLKTAKEEIDKSTSKLTYYCPECGKGSPSTAQFCWGCGKKFDK
jgi:uncharacterized membrane protein YvbJ